jgi:putative sigma-54 modulation protein
MQVTVTFRHVEPTPALRAYAEEKLARVKKYLRRPVDAHVILGVTKDRHAAEITLQADHVTMFAKEETHDLYSAIDLAVDKLEHQAQKLKAKRRDHKDAASVRSGELPTVTATVLAVGGSGPTVVRSQRLPVRPMLLEEALDELAASREDCLVFVDAQRRRLAVLYRRKDGEYGLIEPEGLGGS